MYLKRIEIQGFKSFPDKISILLDTGITSIIGPNGSGKSNISDAVRWVLGEQSSKTLRGSKMEDVIFSGTEQRKPSGFAEVTLLFDNADGGLQLPYSEVSVTRRIYRSGDSEYLINRSQCRLKDINELFFDTGIGREGYTIVGQGKVDEILNDKPEERRGVFEEAAGVTKYKVRRQEAERKLEATSQNLLRIRDIISELNTQLEVLGGQAEVAKKYLQMRDELKEIEVAGYVSSITKYEAQLSKCGQGLMAAREEYDRQTVLLGAAETSAAQAQQRAERIDGAQAALNADMLKIEARLSNAVNQSNLNIEKSSRAKADIERVRGEIGQTGERVTGFEGELAANREKSAYLANELSRYADLLSQKKAEYGAVLSELSESDRSIEELKQQAESARDSYYDVKNKLSGMTAERGHYTKTIAAIEKNIAIVIREIDVGNLSKEELAERRNEYSAKLGRLHAALKDLADRRAVLGASLDEGRRGVNNLAYDLNAKRSRMKILLDMENSFEGFYASVRRVLAECKGSPAFAEGICGAVATLIDVPKDLEVAVSMALGATQQNIVTDDEGAAGKAIAFLKRTSGGRATFLPITSVRGRSLDGRLREKLERQPGYMGVAAELIACDEKYRNIVAELLGATVVVDSLERGLTLAARFKHGFRIVTLEGDVISTSGAITGGSHTERDSGILSRHREIPELRAEAAVIEKGIADMERACAERKAALDALLREIESAEKALNAQQLENAALTQQISHIDEKLGADAGKREVYRQELAEYKRGAAEHDRAIAELTESISVRSSQIDQMQASIDAYTGKHREGQQHRDELLADISAYNVSVASLGEAQKAILESIGRLEGEIADGGKGIVSREAAIKRFERDIEKYASESEALRADIGHAEQEKRGVQLRIESTAAEKASLREEAAALAEEAARVNSLISGAAREISRCETREARINTELDHCKNRLWEDYELTYHNALAMLPAAGKRFAGRSADADTGEAAEGADAPTDTGATGDIAGASGDACAGGATGPGGMEDSDGTGGATGPGDMDDSDGTGGAPTKDGETGAGGAAGSDDAAEAAGDIGDADSADGSDTAAADGDKWLNPPLMGEAAARRSARLREQMRSLGPVNVLSIDEYAQTKERRDKMEEQSLDLEEAGGKLRQIITEMSRLMRIGFEEQFNLINRNFDIVFKELFSGGRARLILSEGKDILEAGVEIEIQLPGKRMQNLMLYSGGERALTVIALIFAMLMLKPAPFCLLDEIESALDEANVERFARYIKKYSGQTQFIMVTHRKGTMEGSNALYGVTMQERGVSGVVSLRLSDAS